MWYTYNKGHSYAINSPMLSQWHKNWKINLRKYWQIKLYNLVFYQQLLKVTSDHVVNMCSYPDGQSCIRELVLIAHQTVCNKMNPTNHTNKHAYRPKNVKNSFNTCKANSILHDHFKNQEPATSGKSTIFPNSSSIVLQLW